MSSETKHSKISKEKQIEDIKNHGILGFIEKLESGITCQHLEEVDPEELSKFDTKFQERKKKWKERKLLKKAEREKPEEVDEDKTDGPPVKKLKLSRSILSRAALPEAKRPIPGIETHENYKFENWGGPTQSFVARWMFVPSESAQVVKIVKFANEQKLRVRCSQYRHTWAHLYSSEGQILIAMLPENVSKRAGKDPPTTGDLHEIKDLKRAYRGKDGVDHPLVQVGPAVTNEQLLEWCVDHKVTYPRNVVLVENTMGGINANCCHGAGIHQDTVADLVYEIEVVDSSGKRRVYNLEKTPAEEFNAVKGCLGLYGIVTRIVLLMDRMTYAHMVPAKEDLEKCIPRRGDKKTPDYKKFLSRVMDEYYSEFFYYPYAKQNYINCWKNDGDEKSSQRLVKSPWWQWIQTNLWHFMIDLNGKLFDPVKQTEIWTSLAMFGMSTKEVTCPVTDALHFHRGIHNMLVLNSELAVPLQPDPADSKVPDLGPIQDAWWATIDQIEAWKKDNKAPVKCELEMRFMRGSTAILAPEGGNQWTCAIEILTFPEPNTTDFSEWEGACQTISDLWLKVIPTATKTRPRYHWAKQWEFLKVNHGDIKNKDAVEYMKHDGFVVDGTNLLPKFRAIRERSGIDPANLFSNPLLDRIFDLAFDSSKLPPVDTTSD